MNSKSFLPLYTMLSIMCFESEDFAYLRHDILSTTSCSLVLSTELIALRHLSYPKKRLIIIILILIPKPHQRPPQSNLPPHPINFPRSLTLIPPLKPNPDIPQQIPRKRPTLIQHEPLIRRTDLVFFLYLFLLRTRTR